MSSEKPKVFFVMKTNDYSGAEAVNFSIINNLKDKYDFYWVSKRGNINNKLEEEGIKWIKINKLSHAEIKKVINKYHPDILHATDFTASVVCAFAAGKTPVISHIHNNATWIKKRCLQSYIYRKSVKRIAKIIVVSESVIDEYVFKECLIDKSRVVGNPVSREKVLNMTGPKVAKKYDICCTARIAPEKNPRMFVDIISDLKKNGFTNISAVWIGKGDIEKEVREYARKNNVNDNIIFAGYRHNPYELMKQAKIFLLSSRYEGYGLAAYEALCLGLPCVVSNVGGLKMIINNDCGRLCSARDEFVDECNLLLTDADYYAHKQKCAYERSKLLDNDDVYFASIGKIYKEVLP